MRQHELQALWNEGPHNIVIATRIIDALASEVMALRDMALEGRSAQEEDE